MSKLHVILIGVVVVVLAVPLVARVAGDRSESEVGEERSQTREAADSFEDLPPPPSLAPGEPYVVNFDPPNGATDVDPRRNEIRVTFSIPMQAGYSWTGGGAHFPAGPQGERPWWTPDGKTCVKPVRLKPDWSYQLGLNSVSFQNFRSMDGVPLTPVVYRFGTRPGN